MRIENLNNGRRRKFNGPAAKDLKGPAFEPPRIVEIHLIKRKMPRPQVKEKRRNPSSR